MTQVTTVPQSTTLTRTVLLFGDQTDSWVHGLDQLYKQAAVTPWLRSFLNQLTAAIKAEATAITLDRKLKDSLGQFSSLQELGDRYRHTTDELGVVRTLLLHAVAAGTLLQWVKQEPHLVGPNSPTEWLGISSGMFTLSALAIADDFDTLFDACLEVGRMLVRACKLVSTRSRALQEEPGHWGWAVLGITPDELRKALHQFQQNNGVPSAKQAKLAVAGAGWSTVIGPPSVLQLFMDRCPTVKTLAKHPMEIRAFQHLLQLSPTDINFIVGNHPDFVHRPLACPDHPLWGMDDAAISYMNWGDLVRDVCGQVLTRPLDVIQAVGRLNSKLVGTASVRIVPAGSTSHAPYVASVLKTAGREVSVMDHRSLVSAGDVAAPSLAGRIAIVGMAGRGPRSANVDQLWDVIMSKRDCYSEVPKERFEVEDFYCPLHLRGDQKCKMTTRYGCFMDNPGHFDSRFFHISPREAILMDPSHRQFLMAAYEAMEVAGYSDGKSRKTDPSRIASFFTQSSDDWLHTSHPSLGCDPYTMQSVQRAFGPARLAWQFQWEGPTYSLDSACAGTTASIHLACLSLLSNDIDMAVAGASNVLSWPHSFSCLSDAGILSDTGNCKPFRDDADGYCRADFVGAVVLKRLEDAVAHNDNVLAIVAGSGRNHSGNSKSITTSDAGAQERLFRKVMRNAQVSPDDISYVEMHGTGTQIGDQAEMMAVANTFKHRLAANGPIFVGGVKANIGHSEAAAGMSELLKCIKMLETKVIPPQMGMEHSLNPKFGSLTDLKIEIPSESRQFRKNSDQPRRILLNNFDAAGGNACLVLEEYMAIEGSGASDPRSSHVVTASARTRVSFEANKRNLVEWLRMNPAIRIEDVAYTTTARRMHHAFKFACAASSVPDLITNLEAADISSSSSSPSKGPPVVFVFSGQASQYAGMGAELYRTSLVFRETVDLCVATCDSLELPTFLDIITTDVGDMSTKDAAQIQLATVTLEIALATFWSAAGIEPTMVMGHSLGEYAALYAAGVLSLVDTLYLVGHRALMLLERCESGVCAMLAVSTSEAIVRECLAQRLSSTCELACINSPNATVISGMVEDLTQLHEDLATRDGRVAALTLDVQYAFHSSQMDLILRDYTALASGVTYSAPQVPVASTLLGSIVNQQGVFGQDYLAQQTRQPVDFVRALHAVNSTLNDPVWLEIGPAAVCTSLVRNTVSAPPAKITHSIDADTSNWTSISKALATLYMNHVNIDWPALHKPYEKELKLQNLPTYAWDMKNYWVTWKEKGREAAPEGKPPTISREPYLASCAQYLVQKSSSPKLQVTFRASISDPDFLALVEGHKMQQIGLASGSVFCDAALATAKYALEDSGRKNVTANTLSCHDPLLLLPMTRDLLGPGGELITTATLESPLSDTISVSFRAKSVHESHNLGSIVVKVCNPERSQAEWDQMSYFVKFKMEETIAMAKGGLGHRLQPEIFYGLFNHAVEFSRAFKGIQEAYIAPDFQEAAALITLPDQPPTCRFVQSPYWSEALLQLAGFMLNGNPNKSPIQTFMVLGFASAEQTIIFEQGKQYLTYTRISRWEKRTAFCDAFVFESNSSRMVMQVRNLRYQELPAATWRHVLEGPHHTKSQARVSGSPNHIAVRQETGNGALIDETGQTALDLTPVEGQARKTRQVDETYDTGVFDLIMASISQSTGDDPSEFSDGTALADLGIDSIMAINVVGIMKNKMGVDLPASFLFDYPTIGDLRVAFGAPATVPEAAKAVPGSNSSSEEQLTPVSLDSEPAAGSKLDMSNIIRSSVWNSDVNTTKTEVHPRERGFQEPKAQEVQAHEEDTSPQPTASITLLQGYPGPGKTPFYLMADGVGSIVSYIHLPKFKSGMPVYGIDSPFLHCASRLTSQVGIEGVAQHVVAALIKAQPTGSFHLGGFSAGCMVAFEVCRQLATVNRKVLGLVLVDLCCPRPSPLDLSAIVEESTVAVDIFKAALTASEVLWSITANTQAHLHAYFMAMRLYNPPPLTAEERPAWVAVIWAEKGLINRVPIEAKVRRTLADEGIPVEPYQMYMQDPKLSPVACLVPDKTAADLGPNGWDRYAGQGVLALSVAATHLDLPMPGTVHLLHQQMEKAFDHFKTSV